jgi:hypothetical protein
MPATEVVVSERMVLDLESFRPATEQEIAAYGTDRHGEKGAFVWLGCIVESENLTVFLFANGLLSNDLTDTQRARLVAKVKVLDISELVHASMNRQLSADPGRPSL